MFRNHSARHLRCAGVAVLLVAIGLLAGCRRDAPPAPAAETEIGRAHV